MARRDRHVFFAPALTRMGAPRWRFRAEEGGDRTSDFQKKSILGVCSILRLYQLGPSPKGGTGKGCQSYD